MTRITKTMAAGLAGMLAMTTPAAAEDFSFRLGLTGKDGARVGLVINKDEHQAGRVGIVISDGKTYGALQVRRVEPIRPAVTVRRVWVEPVYERVTERVWVKTVETRYREVPVLNPYGQVIAYRQEPYTLESGHWETVGREVLVSEGYWITVSDPVPARTGHATISLTAGRLDQHGGHCNPEARPHATMPQKRPAARRPVNLTLASAVSARGAR